MGTALKKSCSAHSGSPEASPAVQAETGVPFFLSIQIYLLNFTFSHPSNFSFFLGPRAHPMFKHTAKLYYST